MPFMTGRCPTRLVTYRCGRTCIGPSNMCLIQVHSRMDGPPEPGSTGLSLLYCSESSRMCAVVTNLCHFAFVVSFSRAACQREEAPAQ